MQCPMDESEIVLARSVDGRTEKVHWIRNADTVWIVTDSQETIIGPNAWTEAWAELHARGFLEVYPNDERKLTAEKDRVLALIRSAFRGVKLGNGVGLRQGQGLDDYADERTLTSYRAQDEKNDWSAIPVADLDRCYSSLSFFDAEGMRFHLPAYLVADLEDSLQTADPLFHLVYTGHGAESRFDMLSQDQREAVRQFLLLRLSDNHRQFDHPMIQAALSNYWPAEPES
jgi:hypothetical protein